MQKLKLLIGKLIVGCVLACCLASNLHAQTNLQFTAVNATVENAIQIFWASQPNHIYQVQYANALATNADGTTAWQMLYDDYPSQGTNTYWLDTGNYNIDPVIPHPKFTSMRFYRILDEGTNDGPSPFIFITTPTNNAVLSDQVTISVTATSSFPDLHIKLYVDGQEMNPSDDDTNFVINTCEWPNGAHTLFATAVAYSSFTGPNSDSAISVGRAVSSYVPVTFSNLISRIAFSQPFFEPSLGQTQEVTAAFAANCDWTLQIIDNSSNVVRTATGSGDSLTFDWDGTGDGETNIPDGVYHYIISAETNGEADEMVEGGEGSPPSPDFAFSDSPELWAISAEGDGSVPLAIYPPGFDTNSLTIFSATPSQVQAASSSFAGTTSFETEDASPAYSGPSAQASTAPTRPPTDPIKNAVDSFAIGYYIYPVSIYPNGKTIALPGNGQPYPATQVIHLDGNDSSTKAPTYYRLDAQKIEAENAAIGFKARGWKPAFIRSDNDLFANSIRRNDQGYGGSEIFTEATIGIFISHGSYGDDLDYSPGASGSKQTYFPSGNPADTGDNAWIRMCQFGFGGNLKWMAIRGCNALCDPNYSSMLSAGGIPLKTTHLLCAAKTITYTLVDEDRRWVQFLLDADEAIPNAWFDAGHAAYKHNGFIPDTIIYRVTGYEECFSDTVTNNTAPYNPSSAPGNLVKIDFQVNP